MPVVVHEKDVLAVVAPLGDVVRDIRYCNSRCSWHSDEILASIETAVNQKIGDCPYLSSLFILFIL